MTRSRHSPRRILAPFRGGSECREPRFRPLLKNRPCHGKILIRRPCCRYGCRRSPFCHRCRRPKAVVGKFGKDSSGGVRRRNLSCAASVGGRCFVPACSRGVRRFFRKPESSPFRSHYVAYRSDRHSRARAKRSVWKMGRPSRFAGRNRRIFRIPENEKTSKRTHGNASRGIVPPL